MPLKGVSVPNKVYLGLDAAEFVAWNSQVSAIRSRSARDRVCILRIMRLRWIFTVISLSRCDHKRRLRNSVDRASAAVTRHCESRTGWPSAIPINSRQFPDGYSPQSSLLCHASYKIRNRRQEPTLLRPHSHRQGCQLDGNPSGSRAAGLCRLRSGSRKKIHHRSTRVARREIPDSSTAFRRRGEHSPLACNFN